MGWVAAAFLLSLLGAAIGFHPSLAGSGWMWFGFGICQVPAAAFTLRKIHRDGDLRELLQPRWGDISLAMGSAFLLLALTWVIRLKIAPGGALTQDWLTKAYEHAGAPSMLEKYWMLILVAVVIISALEEITWRALVLPQFEEHVGTRWAWPLTGLLYGLTFLPSVFWLRAEAGLNPLVVGAAVLAGVVWSYLAVRTRRLIPSILSHAVFVWFVVVQFRLMSW